MVGRVDFFDSFPAREPVAPPRRRRPWWQRPDNVLPASVPGDALLIRTDSAAVWAGAVRVYPNGFQMSVRMVRREPPDGSPRYRPVHHFPPAPFEAVGTGTGLRLGIEYVDGRRDALGEGLASHHFSDDEEERTLRIMDQGGGGDGTTWDAEVWVAPLPPDGPVTLVAVWPGAGATAECRAELDGAAIRAAAARTVTLWPPDEYEAQDGGQWGSVRIATTADDAGGKQAGGA